MEEPCGTPRAEEGEEIAMPATVPATVPVPPQCCNELTASSLLSELLVPGLHCSQLVHFTTTINDRCKNIDRITLFDKIV